MEDGLRIAAGPVAVSARLKPRTEGGMIIDLAVIDDPDALVLVSHGLVARGDVHDGQPAVSEPHRPFHPEPFAVRSPMEEHVSHPLEACLIHGLTRVQANDANDTTHAGTSGLTLRSRGKRGTF